MKRSTYMAMTLPFVLSAYAMVPKIETGNHLDEQNITEIPRLITMSDILGEETDSLESWSGLDPGKYADLNFYKKDGIAHLKGKIMNYSPSSGVQTFSIRTGNDFIRRERVNVGNINSDGSFELDVPVAYPQFDYFELGNIHQNLFLIPGDTLSIVSTMLTHIDPQMGKVADYFGYDGNIDDGVVINVLTDSLISKRYSLDNLYGGYYVATSDSMESEIYKTNERLCGLLDSVVADLPGLLRDMPISSFAKDALSAIAISKICGRMEDLELDFQLVKGPGFKKNDDGTFSYQEGESLDLRKLVSPRLKHKGLIYDNPLLMVDGIVLPNRWDFNTLFHQAAMASRGLRIIPGTCAYSQNYDFGETYRLADSRLDSIGVGNCFVAQMVRTSDFINGMNTDAIPSNKNLEMYGRLLGLLIRHNDLVALNDILMPEYTKFVKNVLIAENSLDSETDSSRLIDASADNDVFQKIISPYKGNVLFIDFWGIGCGPCRAGMISQKPLLAELADKPFKALYVAKIDEMEACKKWLRNEEIKGEHIFVTGDDWTRLFGLFNITGTPHGVLVGKDGKVINPNYRIIYQGEPLLKEALDK